MGRFVFLTPANTRPPGHEDFILWRLSDFVAKWGFAHTKSWLEGLRDRGFSNLLMIVTPTDLAPQFDHPDSAGAGAVSAEQLNQLLADGARLCVAPAHSASIQSDDFAESLLAQLNPPNLTKTGEAKGLSPVEGTRQKELDALLRDLRDLATHAI